MMTVDAEKLFAKLEAMGVAKVEEALAQRRFGERKAPLVELWIDRKREEANAPTAFSDRPQQNQSSVYKWLKSHSWLIMLAIAAIAAIAAITGPISSWSTNSAEDENDKRPEAAANDSKAETSAALIHRADLNRYPDVESFLFGEYSRSEDPINWRSWFFVYSANREGFVEIDRLSCSYPDATRIVRDMEKEYISVACSYPAYFEADEDEENTATAVIRAWLFRSDFVPELVLVCHDCRDLFVRELSLNPVERKVLLTVSTDAKTIVPSSRLDLQIELPNSSSTVMRNSAHPLTFKFSEDWALLDVIVGREP